MSNSALEPSNTRQWHVIGRSDDAQLRHVFQAKLLGRELAVWRADDGNLNIWENRCLHRGVRLSIGMNEGSELKCMYHGWRYANRTGGCTYIPAHPADAPAQTICTRTFPVIEQFGLMWTTMDPEVGAAELGDIGMDDLGLDDLGLDSPFALRSLPIDASPDIVMQALAEYSFGPTGQTDSGTIAVITRDSIDQRALRVTSTVGSSEEAVVLFVQPCDSGESVVHSVLDSVPSDGTEIDVWRHHAQELERVRASAEALARLRPRPTPIELPVERIEPSETLVSTPRSRVDTDIRVAVRRKWNTAIGVAAFELAPLHGLLPTAQPGAHIDVQLPNGLVRQYSLTNQAGSQDSFTIAVKLEPDSRGGSQCLHETVREGDVLSISQPRHNFGLRRDAVRTVLIGGGIGITPLLSMAETLASDGLTFSLEYFAQSEEHLAFKSRLEELGGAFVAHLGLSPEGTARAMKSVLAEYATASHVYICGPGPMLDAARSIAAEAGWPDTAVHFEYFKNNTEISRSSSFTVHLARSGLTLDVHSGESILEVLQNNSVAMPSSCEQGACGTCVVGVIDGTPDHQDVFLKPGEREAGDRIATCVSRASSDSLTLDI